LQHSWRQEEIDVAEVDRDDLIAYYLVLKSRKVRSGTVDRIFVCLSTFYTFLMDEGYIAANPIPIFRRRYLRKYRENSDSETRKIISISDAGLLVHSILDTRDRAMVLLDAEDRNAPRRASLARC
jgi:site-specific recombinase XerD